MLAQAEEVLTETVLTDQATTAKARKSLTEEINTKDLTKGERDAESAARSETGKKEETTTVSRSTTTVVMIAVEVTDARTGKDALLVVIEKKAESVALSTPTGEREVSGAATATNAKAVKDAASTATALTAMAQNASPMAIEERVVNAAHSTQTDLKDAIATEEALTPTDVMTAVEVEIVAKEESAARLAATEERVANVVLSTATAQDARTGSAAALTVIFAMTAEAGKSVESVASTVRASLRLAISAASVKIEAKEAAKASAPKAVPTTVTVVTRKSRRRQIIT